MTNRCLDPTQTLRLKYSKDLMKILGFLYLRSTKATTGRFLFVLTCTGFAGTHIQGIIRTRLMIKMIFKGMMIETLI